MGEYLHHAQWSYGIFVYLPLALVLSLMMFFGWAAIPGIIIGLLLTLAHGMMLEQSIGVLFHFLIPCVLCWGGYRIFVPQRQQVSHGNVRLMPHRLFWQMLLPSVIFLIFVTDCRISWTPSAHNGNDRRYAI
ncbi:cytochrome C-type biogenesis protein [Klebsiella pneumoniae]|uniref:Cytochrome C-type biogenesis protein n=1 Tax=Klebsiella pneumoniae TaxID=573 RepID=A0A378FYD7_KLEPN|nr:cytochrome C-type biogenesis protein [Klebsiella pneumoniae]